MRRTAGFVAVFVVATIFLATEFRRGWTRVETDFPNYYTAAVLTIARQPLRNFYDWTWFQRQMNYTGTERQLGGYIPHTPLSMLPFLPLAALEPQHAKQVWLALNLLLLVATVAVLARLTGFRAVEVGLIACLAYGSLASNFVLGQYYVFLTFLITLAAWCYIRGRDFAAGALLGLIFVLKLYAGPFLLFFLVRRQWRAVAGMVVVTTILAAGSIAWFGFDANLYFVNTVFARGADGSVNDPYHPYLGSMASLLRRLFVPEAELNPHPVLAAPALFFFLQALFTLGVLGLALAQHPRERSRDFACFVAVLLLLSPNTAEYTFVILLAPAVLLLRQYGAILVVFYALLEIPLQPWDASLYPKIWLLVALVVLTASKIKPLHAGAVLACAAIVSAGIAWSRMQSYTREPAEHALVEPNAIFASAPALAGERMVYQSIGDERYVLRSAAQTLGFEGHAFHPALPASGDRVYFELAAEGHSRICAYDFAAKQLSTVVDTRFDPTEPAISPDGSTVAFIASHALYVVRGGAPVRVADSAAGPAFFPDGRRVAFTRDRSIAAVDLDTRQVRVLASGGDFSQAAISGDGRWLAFVAATSASRQVWVQDLATGVRSTLTGGACNNDSPAWKADSSGVVFASDCDRGLGLPALYGAKIISRR